MLLEIKDRSARIQYFELRISMNGNEGDYVLEKIKKQKTTFTLIGGIEAGEKEHFKHVEHVHCVLLYKNPKSVQGLINEIGIIGCKNEEDEQLGYDIKQIPKEDILERILYAQKWKTKVGEERCKYIEFKPCFWDLIYSVKTICDKSKKKSGKTTVELQIERLEIAKNCIYDDILTSEDPRIIEHKGYFAGSAGIKFYSSVRDKEIMKTIKEVGYKYNCLPNPDCDNKGEIRLYQNIMVCGLAGAGKTRTMLKLLELMNKEVYMITPRPYMDRYDPRKYDVLFWDDIDATDIKEYGGIAKLKKQTDGKPFTYEEKYMKACLSDYKPWWFTSNTEYLGDFKDKNDKNDNCGLADQLNRRMHVLSIEEFCKNFGIMWDKIKKEYKRIKPIPLIHRNGHYVEKSRYERELMELEDKKN